MWLLQKSTMSRLNFMEEPECPEGISGGQRTGGCGYHDDTV